MATDPGRPVEARLIGLLQQLGISRAHIAGRELADFRGLASSHPDVIASLTLVCPGVVDAGALRSISDRLLLISGDGGPFAPVVPRLAADLPNAVTSTLTGYDAKPWSDFIADRSDQIGDSLLTFLERCDGGVPPLTADRREGIVEGISYRIAGEGPPLVLLPLGLAPSQWDPLIPVLSRRFSTITLGGAWLGMAAVLESRARSETYHHLLRNLLDRVPVRQGVSILDVGCGSGAVARGLARSLLGDGSITAVDSNRSLLREAETIAKDEQVADRIRFQSGDIEALPFPADQFDLTVAVTVLEEVDADRALAEMVRVTKPGGSVAIVVRAIDLPRLHTLPITAAIKAKVDTIGWGAGANAAGCADASLPRRLREAGLVDVTGWPQLAVVEPGPYFQMNQAQVLDALSAAQAHEWREAAVLAQEDGTFSVALPYHCAIGRKPG